MSWHHNLHYPQWPERRTFTVPRTTSKVIVMNLFDITDNPFPIAFHWKEVVRAIYLPLFCDWKHIYYNYAFATRMCLPQYESEGNIYKYSMVDIWIMFERGYRIQYFDPNDETNSFYIDESMTGGGGNFQLMTRCTAKEFMIAYQSNQVDQRRLHSNWLCIDNMMPSTEDDPLYTYVMQPAQEVPANQDDNYQEEGLLSNEAAIGNKRQDLSSDSDSSDDERSFRTSRKIIRTRDPEYDGYDGGDEDSDNDEGVDGGAAVPGDPQPGQYMEGFYGYQEMCVHLPVNYRNINNVAPPFLPGLPAEMPIRLIPRCTSARYPMVYHGDVFDIHLQGSEMHVQPKCKRERIVDAFQIPENNALPMPSDEDESFDESDCSGYASNFSAADSDVEE